MTETKEKYTPPRTPTLEEIDEIKKTFDEMENITAKFETNPFIGKYLNNTERNQVKKINVATKAAASRVDTRMKRIKDEIINGSERREYMRVLNKKSTKEIAALLKNANKVAEKEN